MRLMGYLSRNMAGAVVLYLIRQYQRYLSPVFGQHCRYYPTCSQYVMDSVTGLGLWRGSLVGLWRIVRCNPFSRGGHDPFK